MIDNITPSQYSNVITRLDACLDNDRELKTNYGRSFWTTVVLVGISCYILGTNHKSISPHIKSAYNTFMDIKHITPKGTEQ